MEREGYKGNSSDADGEQNEFGQGPGVDLTQGGTFTLSTEYTRDSSYKKKTDFNIRVYGELLKAQLSESSIIQRLSCSMRLTQQSNFHRSRRLPGPTISNRSPWDEKW